MLLDAIITFQAETEARSQHLQGQFALMASACNTLAQKQHEATVAITEQSAAYTSLAKDMKRIEMFIAGQAAAIETLREENAALKARASPEAIRSVEASVHSVLTRRQRDVSAALETVKPLPPIGGAKPAEPPQ